MDQGQQKTGSAEITSHGTLEVGALSPDTSTQKAELIALTRALHLGKGKRITIYTDSNYTFSVIHAYGAIWKERGLLTTGNKEIRHSQEVLNLLTAVMKPKGTGGSSLPRTSEAK